MTIPLQIIEKNFFEVMVFLVIMREGFHHQSPTTRAFHESVLSIMKMIKKIQFDIKQAFSVDLKEMLRF